MNRRVLLKSYNGTLSPPGECRAGENYWLLVGKHGTAIEPANERSRVLVRFDDSVTALGLHCHNPVPNTLLILESDLQFVD